MSVVRYRPESTDRYEEYSQLDQGLVRQPSWLQVIIYCIAGIFRYFTEGLLDKAGKVLFVLLHFTRDLVLADYGYFFIMLMLLIFAICRIHFAATWEDGILGWVILLPVILVVVFNLWKKEVMSRDGRPSKDAIQLENKVKELVILVNDHGEKLEKLSQIIRNLAQKDHAKEKKINKLLAQNYELLLQHKDEENAELRRQSSPPERHKH